MPSICATYSERPCPRDDLVPSCSSASAGRWRLPRVGGRPASLPATAAAISFPTRPSRPTTPSAWYGGADSATPPVLKMTLASQHQLSHPHRGASHSLAWLAPTLLWHPCPAGTSRSSVVAEAKRREGLWRAGRFFYTLMHEAVVSACRTQSPCRVSATSLDRAKGVHVTLRNVGANLTPKSAKNTPKFHQCRSPQRLEARAFGLRGPTTYPWPSHSDSKG
mmetsp:Transcript_36958/g.104302  ORF Transcript_36958/g.104302 Transcript_36958/m.104302 type:complete len:221 (-) Transcript_36958:174-836(-)